MAFDRAGRRDGQGHGVVVEYHSDPFVESLLTEGLSGAQTVVMLGSSLSDEPLDP